MTIHTVLKAKNENLALDYIEGILKSGGKLTHGIELGQNHSA